MSFAAKFDQSQFINLLIFGKHLRWGFGGRVLICYTFCVSLEIVSYYLNGTFVTATRLG